MQGIYNYMTEVHHVCTVCNFLQQNQLDALISQIYFWNKTLPVSDISPVHHQEFFTVRTAVVYVITACEPDQFRPDPARKLYDIPV